MGREREREREKGGSKRIRNRKGRIAVSVTDEVRQGRLTCKIGRQPARQATLQW